MWNYCISLVNQSLPLISQFLASSNLKMQSVIFTVLATVALASAGGLQGSYQSQYVQHSHAVVAHAAPAVVHHAPIVHAAPIVHHQPIVRVAHAAPVAIATPTLYKTVVPTAYASSYSYRAPAAKVLKAVVHQPIVYAAPRPVYQSAVIAHAPVAYASGFNYRTVSHHVAHPVVRVATPIVHHTPVVRVAHAPVAVHHSVPLAHHGVLLH